MAIYQHQGQFLLKMVVLQIEVIAVLIQIQIRAMDHQLGVLTHNLFRALVLHAFHLVSLVALEVVILGVYLVVFKSLC